MQSLAIEPKSIAPPQEHLELGDRIRYHHRACVARLPKRESGTGIFAGPDIPRTWEPIRVEGGQPNVDYFWPETPNWWTRMPTDGPINKTIICWHEIGEGFVFGLIRRGIGVSHSGYTSGYEYPEWEPGWFDVHEWHWLYAVKTVLTGLHCIYVPLWAAERID